MKPCVARDNGCGGKAAGVAGNEAGAPSDKETSMTTVRRGLLLTVGAMAALGLGARARADELAPLERVQVIQLHGRPDKKLDHMTLDAKRDRLLIANMANRTLDVVDLKAGKLLKEVPDQRGIQGVAYAPDLDRVFVGLGVGGLCNAFDGE